MQMSEFTHDGGAWEYQLGGHEGSPFSSGGSGGHDGLGTVHEGGNPGFSAEDGFGATSEVIGNPAEYKQDWFYQQHNGYCVPSSLAQVVEAQTAVDELAGYLEQGRSVVLAVNASPIWYGNADIDNPAGQADHAVVVTAINDQTGMVTLSDPGSPDGNEEQVPLDTFLQAWSASDYDMLVTDRPAAGAGPEVATETTGHEIAADAAHGTDTVVHTVAHTVEAGFVILPIALGAQWAYTSIRKHL